MYMGVTKTCPFCSSTNAEYKFLNNKSIHQPRYKCLGCRKYFTHNPASRRKKHPRGYAKIAVAFAELLPNIADVSCPNPSCEKIGASKFLYFNNKNVGQPRYKCGACKTSFTNRRRRSLDKNRSAQAVDISEEPTEQQMLDKIGSDLLPKADSPSIVELMESRDVPEAGTESFLDEINWDGLQDIDPPSFPEMMQSRDVVEQASEKTLNENNLAERPDIDSSSFMEMMQSLDVPEKASERISDENNPVEYLLNIDSRSFMDKWESLNAPEEANDQPPEEIKWVDASDMDWSSFMGMVQLSDVPKEASEQLLDETNPAELRDIDYSSFTEITKLLDVPEKESEQILDENNPVELLNIDSPDFMAMLQSHANPIEWGIQWIYHEE